MTEIKDDIENTFETIDSFDKTSEEAKETENKEILNQASAEDYLRAPAGYTKEYAKSFASLPEEWRKYLHTREDEINQGFKQLNDRVGNIKSIDEAYNRRAEILKSYGVKSKEDWISNLVRIDELLTSNPFSAIKMLSETYGVSMPTVVPSETSNEQIKSLTRALNINMTQSLVDNFMFGRDEKGDLLHPYCKEVGSEMHSLLANGMAKNLQEAYDTAVWLNPSTRNRLLAKSTQETLELKSKNAKKSKEAAFAPKGKTELDTKDLTLREELEMRYDALFGSEEDVD